MLRTKISLASVALAIFTCQLALPNCAGAQQTEVGNVTLRIEVEGPVSILPDAEAKLDAFLEYIAKLKEWHSEAIAVAERLEKDGKLYPEDGDESDPNKISQPYVRNAWKVGYNPLHNQVISFPQSVVDQMRPQPEPVAIPESTQVSLRLHLTNNSDKPLDINEDVYCDVAGIGIVVSGPRAWHRRNYNVHTTTDYKMGRRRTLKPGESFTIRIKSLAHGQRGLTGNWALCQSGEYELTLNYQIRGLKPVSATAKFKVSVANETDEIKK